jgi:branched-subunit amino acid transport protein
MYFEGIIIGIGTFIIIGIFHPIVIKGEYHIGKKIWPVFLVAGIIAIIISLFLNNVALSALIGVLGFTLLWSIHEIIEQEKRVEKGWFPKNPKKEEK